MPASLPGDNRAGFAGGPAANPNAGGFVIFDPLSGPKGSPLDARKITFSATGTPTYAADPTQQNSTGALNTGIGIGCNRVIGLTPNLPVASPTLYAIFKAGFNDDMQPGQKQDFSAAPPPGNTSANTVDSTRMYIGGGRQIKNVGVTPADRGRPFIPSPYTAGISICGAGNGGSRDGGAGPAFTGFPMKMVTAAGAVANGAAIEGTFVNRSGVGLAANQSAFGSSSAALAAPA